jgi:hypothetical protein
MSHVVAILYQTPSEEGATNNGPVAVEMGPTAYQNKPPSIKTEHSIRLNICNT